MKLYVAGNFEHDRDKVAAIAYALEEEGIHSITFKWWENIELNHRKPEKAMLDLDGVCDSDALVVYMEETHRYQGTWVEVGAALGRGIPVYFIGDEGDSCIFRYHPRSLNFQASFPDGHAVLRVREALKS